MVKLYENNARFGMCDCVIRIYFTVYLSSAWIWCSAYWTFEF